MQMKRFLIAGIYALSLGACSSPFDAIISKATVVCDLSSSRIIYNGTNYHAYFDVALYNRSGTDAKSFRVELYAYDRWGEGNYGGYCDIEKGLAAYSSSSYRTTTSFFGLDPYGSSAPYKFRVIIEGKNVEKWDSGIVSLTHKTVY